MPHNGGRTVLNLSSVQTGGDFPFKNALKGAQQWLFGDSSGVPAPDTLSTKGYPTSISNGGVQTVFYIPTSTQRPGNWKLRWTGTGTVTAAGGGGEATDGEYTFAPSQDAQSPGNRVVLAITTGTNISSVEFFHVDDEVSLDAGGIYTQKFLDTLAYLRPGVLRFLNWQQGNITNVVAAKHRKPLDYAFWAGQEMRASIYGGVTTNSGDDYSCSAPSDWDGLVHGAMVTVKFNASSTGTTPRLNVGGTGLVNVRNVSGNEMDANHKPASGRFGTFIYDADLEFWLKFGGDGVQYFDHFIQNGIPREAMLALCEEVGAHPYLVRPYLSCDPETDWLENDATWWDANAPSWMKIHHEVPPNELWNESGDFYGTPYATNKAEARWGDGVGNWDEWVGMVASTGGQTLHSVYSGDRTRYEAVVGVKTHGSTSPTARLQSTLYVAEDAGLAAKDYITKIAAANYFRDTYTFEQRTQAASDYDAATAAEKAEIAEDFVLSTLVDEGGDQYQFSKPRLLTLVSAFKSWAQSVDSRIGLLFYEGDWSPDYTGNATIDALYEASKSVPRLREITRDLYFELLALGVTLPASYRHSGPNAAWSIYDPDVYAAASPRAQAIHLFNRRQRAVTLT